ncbi:glutamate ABC transporter substrate-binding protein, partial [Kitasatospora sp. NPDC059571]|uniref:glutamate ABC transporter substrate-binding protein n=1 Tax=Kitasatospora sp. NPDC059571 TaxID=3346871 RepID=UPI0036844CE8
RSAAPAKDPDGAAVRRIRQRGTLVVGVDQNSYDWGFRDPRTGRIEGFDIDLAHAVAASLLGDPDRVTFRTVPTARRIDAVRGGEVDLVVRTMTITCDRLKEVAFSAPYFRSGQQAVVPKSARITDTAKAFAGRRACVAAQSSSEAELKRDPRGTTGVTVVDNQLDCLVLMQLGRVDTTLTDTVLGAAQAAQDPGVEVVGDTIAPAYLGIAAARSAPDLVAWVNQVLLDYRADGGWRRSYDRWLAPTMGASPERYLP